MNKPLLTVFSIMIVLGLSFVGVSISMQKEVDVDFLFQELPEKPDNFIIVTRDIQAGINTIVCDVGEEYYLQPSFYPTWDRNKDLFYSNHNYDRWGVHGYGTYPGEVGVRVRNMKKGDTLTHCTFLKTSWGIESYQGIQLVPIPNEYFDLQVDKSIILMGRTFPRFDKNWVQPLQVTAVAKKDIPSGRYELGFNILSPPKDVESEFYRIILDKEVEYNEEYLNKCAQEINEDCEKLFMLRQNKYVSGGQWQTGKKLFNLVIEVE